MFEKKRPMFHLKCPTFYPKTSDVFTQNVRRFFSNITTRQSKPRHVLYHKSGDFCTFVHKKRQ